MEIREYVINNFKNSNEEDIRNSIMESIRDRDEITLPGLGVLFELLWESSSEDMKNKIISSIGKKLKQKTV